MIPNGAQSICSQLGKAGCYFISICKIAEESGADKVELLTTFSDCLRKGWVKADGFVQDAGAIMSYLTNQKWMCLKAGKGHELPEAYAVRPGEREILRYERSAMVGTENAHFVVGDGTGRVAWDPIGAYSATVITGKMVSRRIFRRVI